VIADGFAKLCVNLIHCTVDAAIFMSGIPANTICSSWKGSVASMSQLFPSTVSAPSDTNAVNVALRSDFDILSVD
jgi:hypothetical protein